MMIAKKIIIGLIVLLIILTIYSVVAGNSSYKEIKALNKEIKVKVDSIKIVKKKYKLLEESYDSVAIGLVRSKKNLSHLKTKVDSVLNLEIQSLTNLRNTLNTTLQNQADFEKVTEEEIFQFPN
jgi:septal ring factor EnvC (AmiA/AmiB activator)